MSVLTYPEMFQLRVLPSSEPFLCDSPDGQNPSAAQSLKTVVDGISCAVRVGFWKYTRVSCGFEAERIRRECVRETFPGLASREPRQTSSSNLSSEKSSQNGRLFQEGEAQ